MSGQTRRKRGETTAIGSLAARFAKLGIHHQRDLVFHLPLRYEDETVLTLIQTAQPGVALQVEGEVISCEVMFRPRRQLVARIRDVSGVLVVRWLHFYPSQQKQLAPGRRVRLFGEVREGFWGIEMVHPKVKSVTKEDALPETLTPVYSTTVGLSQTVLRKQIAQALEAVTVEEWLPAEVLNRLGLSGINTAIRLLHSPPPDVDISALQVRTHPAWRRIKLEELIVQQLSLRQTYNARRVQGAAPLLPKKRLSDALLAQLPFALTSAQQRVVEEIAVDLSKPYPMQRLLQGDVGSGKTLVAALAMLQTVENGRQAVLMAPTEILAEQHWKKLTAWLEPMGLEVAWLSGGQKKRERDVTLARLVRNDVLLVVGTHALIEDPVVLPRLALVVVDEQHRFGVRQRLALRGKGEEALQPHMLMMSATPIPRTLAMTHYADLDVSVLDELPPGRTPVLTKLISEKRRAEVVERVRAACLAGQQAYWVCPLIEESEVLQLKTAQETFEMLSTALPELQVGLMHGRMRTEEKSAVMTAFVSGSIHLLVATTVIEVGVDVPNASLMVIEHAERFGLAQLHQLRGRVGRGSHESVCILIFAQPLSETGRARLKIIYQHNDGFEIAREDLTLRGPGEFIGARQSGVPLLRYADLEQDADLIEPARQLAERVLSQKPVLADQLIQNWFGGKDALLRV